MTPPPTLATDYQHTTTVDALIISCFWENSSAILHTKSGRFCVTSAGLYTVPVGSNSTYGTILP